ncbi:hypothetical protein HYQ46_007978 [Verticillium longisporum]|nr:hypothetical protein HYQ46_007978 [Verticillium longisporum]
MVSLSPDIDIWGKIGGPRASLASRIAMRIGPGFEARDEGSGGCKLHGPWSESGEAPDPGLHELGAGSRLDDCCMEG